MYLIFKNSEAEGVIDEMVKWAVSKASMNGASVFVWPPPPKHSPTSSCHLSGKALMGIRLLHIMS